MKNDDKMKILIVEDDTTFAQIIEGFLMPKIDFIIMEQELKVKIINTVKSKPSTSIIHKSSCP